MDGRSVGRVDLTSLSARYRCGEKERDFFLPSSFSVQCRRIFFLHICGSGDIAKDIKLIERFSSARVCSLQFQFVFHC